MKGDLLLSPAGVGAGLWIAQGLQINGVGGGDEGGVGGGPQGGVVVRPDPALLRRPQLCHARLPKSQARQK